MARSYEVEEPSEVPRSPKSQCGHREVSTMVEEGIEDYEEALSAKYAAEEAADMATTTWAAFDDY